MATISTLALLRVALGAYTAKIKQKILARKPPSSPDSERLNGLTPEEIRAGVSKQMIGLDDMLNLGIADAAQVPDLNPNDAYISPNGARRAVQVGTKLVGKAQGATTWGEPEVGAAVTFAEVRSGNNPQNQRWLRTRKFLERLNVVRNQFEYDQTIAAKESFAEVFNSWARFSHNGTTQPALPAELTAWNYDGNTDSIKSALNSVTLIGFVSYEAFEDYDLEVELSSDNADDGWIGVVLGYVELNGQQNTLVAMRTLNHDTDTFFVAYNYRLTATNGEYTLASNNGGLANPNPYRTENGGKGWQQCGALRLRVKRRGDVLEIWTTLPNAPLVWHEASKITINLSSDPRLDKFRGPSRFGYCAQSQQNATWSSLVRPGERRPIYRLDTKTVYLYQNGNWVQQSAGAENTYVTPNTFYFNQVTKCLFMTDADTNFIPINRRP